MTRPFTRREALLALGQIDPRVNVTPLQKLWAAQGEYQLIQASRLAGASLSKEESKAFAASFAAKFAGERITQITEGTRKLARRTIEKGLEIGMTQEELASALESSGAFSLARAQVIAQTEVTRAIGEAHSAGFKKAGVDAKIWTTTSANVRDAHAALDGTKIPIDDYFEWNGARAKAPGGFSDPALSVNCRCILVPGALDKKPPSPKARKAAGNVVNRSAKPWQKKTTSLVSKTLKTQKTAVVNAIRNPGSVKPLPPSPPSTTPSPPIRPTLQAKPTPPAPAPAKPKPVAPDASKAFGKKFEKSTKSFTSYKADKTFVATPNLKEMAAAVDKVASKPDLLRKQINGFCAEKGMISSDILNKKPERAKIEVEANLLIPGTVSSANGYVEFDSGRMKLSKNVFDNAKSFIQKIAKYEDAAPEARAKILDSIESKEANYFRTLIHETTHSHSPASGLGYHYTTAAGMKLEEVTVELAARQIVKDKFPELKEKLQTWEDRGQFGSYPAYIKSAIDTTEQHLTDAGFKISKTEIKRRLTEAAIAMRGYATTIEGSGVLTAEDLQRYPRPEQRYAHFLARHFELPTEDDQRRLADALIRALSSP